MRRLCRGGESAGDDERPGGLPTPGDHGHVSSEKKLPRSVSNTRSHAAPHYDLVVANGGKSLCAFQPETSLNRVRRFFYAYRYVVYRH